LKNNSTSSRKAQSADGRFAVEISGAVLEEMFRLCAGTYPKETGGVLIGHYSEDHKTAYVTDLVPAPSDSVLKRFSFIRGVRGLQQLLRRFWPRRKYYLGEWHFHPDGAPSPSGTDSDQMRDIASALSYQCPEPLLVILGGNPPARVDLQSYIFTRGTRDAIPLETA
jgi:integrative and conjugative element protein (TIGR02256 family)